MRINLFKERDPTFKKRFSLSIPPQKVGNLTHMTRFTFYWNRATLRQSMNHRYANQVQFHV